MLLFKLFKTPGRAPSVTSLFAYTMFAIGFGLTQTAMAQIPPSVAKALAQQGISTANVSLIAQPLKADTALVPIAAHQINKSMNPASVMKLVTSYAALSALGPDYRWRTSAYLQGDLVGDVLTGNMAIKGGGDPKIVIEDLMEWLASWRRAGLREIRGDLVIDESLYAELGASMESFDGDPGQPYNVRPHPLMMNFKATKFVVTPQQQGGLTITLDPPLADVALDNQITTVAGICRYRAAGLTISDAGPTTIRLAGRYSPSCGETSSFAAALDHRPFIFGLVKAAWLANGGEWKGSWRIGKAQGRDWSQWRSPRTLSDVVRDINKFSNNVMTRQVLMQTGYENLKQAAASRVGTVANGREVVRGTLLARGLSFPELVIENGSGLSRIERVSVNSLVQLLSDASRSKLFEIFRDSMPVVGVDGTMRKRLTDKPIAGNAWIKTGSIEGVSSIAGYVLAKSGTLYAVSFIVNGAGALDSSPAQDQFLLWVFEQG
jgi:serine-type D-Ala-D-Ala carboxypeptidase/endopeptidase (penicillin-binding protein 4)